ncbi:DUF2232 domain-containing protein [Cinnamomum micranthum f. kanehirae]|uniref:DUF2232 domain-containing protein n=1 Tax=Cinnamomum micranthum f. kanehirae TaxID=337451 RepID=A0A443Q3X7_9MAGN|nr:DUF2232 domain-containing protein [Cinnamomum micranthum f. kanehirae]
MSLLHYLPSVSFRFSPFPSLSPLRISSLSFPAHTNTSKSPLRERNAFFSATFSSSNPPMPLSKSQLQNPRVISNEISGGFPQKEVQTHSEIEDLATDGPVFQKTLRLVECSMFAAVSGLLYFLSNSLAIENYFGCFFSLPIVISSMRWGVSAGRKTMVATAMLLLTLSGPVKASTYLVSIVKSLCFKLSIMVFSVLVVDSLMHGLVGLAMGSLWRLGADWGLSILLCTTVRAIGLLGYVLISSFLIRENILALITINIHASLTFVFAALGLNTIPSMEAIYAIFGTLLLLNSGFFVFLLHILYAVFLTKLGMKSSLTLPKWLEKAV